MKPPHVPPSNPRIVVIGAGNVVFCDDGLGVHAARLLQDDTRLPGGVEILDGGTLGLTLLPYVMGASHVLILDAIDVDEPPGTLIRMTGSELLDMSRGRSAHQLGVVDLVAALGLVSKELPEIVILGAQPARTDWGARLSSQLEPALAPLAERALAQLNTWLGEFASAFGNRAGVAVERTEAAESLEQEGGW